jgi:2-phosphosulfolactate phosphatase
MVFSQSEFDVRCEWGEAGVAALAPISDVVILIDVICFSTDVVIANQRGATIYPYRIRDDGAEAYAASIGAVLARSRLDRAGYSLSPGSLLEIEAGTLLVLPSPNGSTLSLATGATPTLLGCLRNARAVAAAAQKIGRRIAVIPAGERWRADHSLRPAFEDWVAAGAIISQIEDNLPPKGSLPPGGGLSPEARSAVATFMGVKSDLAQMVEQCISGKELAARGFASDNRLCSDLDASDCVPILQNGAFVRL